MAKRLRNMQFTACKKSNKENTTLCEWVLFTYLCLSAHYGGLVCGDALGEKSVAVGSECKPSDTEIIE